ENTKMPGLQHKYQQTALILATNSCAMYCRHCFRKRLVGLPTEETLRRFNDAVKYIETHKEVNNVLITGGDPFVLPTNVIAQFLDKLSPFPHLEFIRFGSRVPVTFPNRILDDKELLTLLKNNTTKSKRVYVVTQFNHPKEITPESADAVDALIRSDVIVNNQTVLLHGVNDNPETLAELQNKLVGIGVNPYYVFQCRPVKRVKSHFQVPLYKGYEIVEEAKKRLNGHSKRFKYIMSHQTGKIEIVGIMDGYIYFKYHQAKEYDNIGKFFKRKLNNTAGWLDELD
ncbi:MAG: KamA family radical SAM protein, partial [Methanosarcinales archaeon]